VKRGSHSPRWAAGPEKIIMIIIIIIIIIIHDAQSTQQKMPKNDTHTCINKKQ
jgi:hypothetical protein